jgi:hypothetical protein
MASGASRPVGWKREEARARARPPVRALRAAGFGRRRRQRAGGILGQRADEGTGLVAQQHRRFAVRRKPGRTIVPTFTGTGRAAAIDAHDLDETRRRVEAQAFFGAASLGVSVMKDIADSASIARTSRSENQTGAARPVVPVLVARRSRRGPAGHQRVGLETAIRLGRDRQAADVSQWPSSRGAQRGHDPLHRPDMRRRPNAREVPKRNCATAVSASLSCPAVSAPEPDRLSSGRAPLALYLDRRIDMPVLAPHQATDGSDALVRDARAGDNHAWTRLVARYERLVSTIARSYACSHRPSGAAGSRTRCRLARDDGAT